MKRTAQGTSTLLLRKSASENAQFIGWIGIDEAGRGCLAGPVVAGAVVFAADFDVTRHLQGLGDSKKLSVKKRHELAPLIMAHADAYGLGLSWQDEIDAVNILNATLRAMARAVLNLAGHAGWTFNTSFPGLVVDGAKQIPEETWSAASRSPECGCPWDKCLPSLRPFAPSSPVSPLDAEFIPPRQKALPGADALIPCVSAASILAKTARDELMIRFDAEYPGYGFAAHKGYGVPEHLAALNSSGPCALHRMSFAQVRPNDQREVRQGRLL